MKNSFLYFAFTLFIFINYKSQNSNNLFDKIVFEVKGDLNKDNLIDMVTVKENSKSKYSPYQLEIKFKNTLGEFTSVFLSEKAIPNKFPYGDERTEVILENLEIKNGILIFSNQLIRGRITHKFRFQNGNFELIGYTFHNASPGFIEYVDYNLSTGKKILRKTAYETDKVLSLIETSEKINPLPKLQDFTPFDFMY